MLSAKRASSSPWHGGCQPAPLMEILPTLALVPGAPGQPETITSGGDDPFLALLAGLMQPPAQPSTPLSIKAGPAGDPAAAAASGQTLTPSSPQPPTLPPSASDQPVATATVAPEVGPIAPATVAIRISAALREPLAAPETAFDPPQEPAVVAKVVPMAPLSPSWMAKAAAPKAEAAAAGGELRPKAVTASHRHQPDRSDEDQVLTDDPGEVPTTVAPVPSSVTPADAHTAATAPAHSPGRREPGALGRPRWHWPARGPPAATRSRPRGGVGGPSSPSPARSKDRHLRRDRSRRRRGESADECHAHRARAATYRRGRVAAPPDRRLRGG